MLTQLPSWHRNSLLKHIVAIAEGGVVVGDGA